MQSNLIIPKDIVVGLQGRRDSLTEQLGFVTFHDGKVLRQEKSWNNWRDQKQNALHFKNEPTSGFIISKGVQRYGYYGSGRSVVRVYDPRGFEFEISLDNLVFVLMHSNVSMQDIQEKCVYAWHGKNLVLVPVNSQEYQESIKYTDKQAIKFSAKDLVLGHIYSHKKEKSEFVYIGMQDYFDYDCMRIIKKREHIFYNTNSKKFEPLKMNVLAETVSDGDDYSVAGLVELYHNTKESSAIDYLYTKDITQANSKYGYITLFKIEENQISKIEVSFQEHRVSSIYETIIDKNSLEHSKRVNLILSNGYYGNMDILEEHKFYTDLKSMIMSEKHPYHKQYNLNFIKKEKIVDYLINLGYSNKVYAKLKNQQEFVLLKS